MKIILEWARPIPPRHRLYLLLSSEILSKDFVQNIIVFLFFLNILNFFQCWQCVCQLPLILYIVLQFEHGISCQLLLIKMIWNNIISTCSNIYQHVDLAQPGSISTWSIVHALSLSIVPPPHKRIILQRTIRLLLHHNTICLTISSPFAWVWSLKLQHTRVYIPLIPKIGRVAGN